MNKTVFFRLSAWHEYCDWQNTDKTQVKRINEGIGKPEALKHEWNGYWSRRIDERHRLVYQIMDDTIEMAQCGGHYDE